MTAFFVPLADPKDTLSAALLRHTSSFSNEEIDSVAKARATFRKQIQAMEEVIALL